MMRKVSRLQKTDWNCRVPNGRPRAEENAQHFTLSGLIRLSFRVMGNKYKQNVFKKNLKPPRKLHHHQQPKLQLVAVWIIPVNS